MKHAIRIMGATAMLLVSAAWFSPPSSLAAPERPEALEGVRVDDRSGQTLDLELELEGADGRYLLSERLIAGKPTLLTFNYFKCRGVCDLQLRMIARDLPAWGLEAGEDFNLVSLSFDPEDTPESAADRVSLLGLDSDDEAAWLLGVGNAEEALKRAKASGIEIRPVEGSDQWAHPAVAVVLSPDGTIASYLGGVRPEPRDVRFALVGASRGELGSFADFIWMSCFSYDPHSQSYVPVAWKLMRLGGAATVLMLGSWLGFMWRSRPEIEEVPC